MEENKLGFSRAIARFIVETRSSDIPDYLHEHAEVAFLDWFAVTMAGKEEPLVLKLIKHADLFGGYEQATVLGHGLKKSASWATLINGSASHALDYDDNLAIFHGHPSVTLFPALVSLSEWKEINGLDFLSAYIIGLEAGAAIGGCAGFKEHYAKGWHGTSTVGRMASVAACANLLNLNEQQTVYALGIAGTQASGLRRVFGTMCKPFHAGRASQVGLEAALLAQEGFSSAEDILEGPEGFFQVLGGQKKEEAIASLGKTWNLENVVQKFHASCLETHAAMEAALAIVKENNLLLDEIHTLKVYTTPICLNVAGIQEPKTGLEGKFSVTYCLANALLRGETGPQAFTDDKVKDPEIRQFMKRISLKADPELSGTAARVEIETHRGQVFQKYVDPLIPPSLEVKIEKVRKKFMDLCVPVMNESRAALAMEAILSLEKVENIKELIERLRL